MTKKNFIIGGGLTAAAFSYYTKNQNNIILEKENRMNGRIKSITTGGNGVEMGAQFFCREDKNIYNLVREINLDSKMKRMNLNNFSISHDNKLLKLENIATNQCDDSSREELKRFYEFIQNQAIELFEKPSGELLSDNLEKWYHENFGKNSDWLIKGLIRAVTFAEPKELAALYGLFVVSTFFEPCYTISGGLELINKKLLSLGKPKIMKNNNVTDIKVNDNKIKEIEINNLEKININNNDSVISTVPSRILADLLPASDLKNDLEKIKYNCCGATLIKTKSNLLDYDGVLLSKNEGISAIIDIPKCYNFKSRNGYILILTPYKNGDNNVFEDTLTEANNLIQNLEENIEETQFYAWDYGLPEASPELFITQKKVDSHEIENLYICGDFMRMPSLDACVESSRFVAEKIKN